MILHTDPSVHKSEARPSVRDTSAPMLQRFEFSVKLTSQYPAFDLCMCKHPLPIFVTDDSAADPAVYPYSLSSIYPTHGSVVSISSSVYPTPTICKPAYVPSRF